MDELAKMSDALEAGVMLLMDQNPGPKGDALSLEDGKYFGASLLRLQRVCA